MVATSDAPEDVRGRVLALARAEGFVYARVAPAAPLAAARATALARRHEGSLADMAWMTEEWLMRATDPAAFLAGARSVLMVALPARAKDPPLPAGGPPRGRVARYARGRDYHRVFEARLRRLARQIRQEFAADARATVDYGPLLERPLAAAAGMGWLGKSTMLLVPGAGPWVLLGAVATTLALEPDAPLRKSCGNCTRCIVACPTQALDADGTMLDARRCISYHTIENRGPIPRELRPLFGDWVFGCDACLDVCPPGRQAGAPAPEFDPPDLDAAMPVLAELLALDEAAFAERFRGRAILRAKRDGLVRNACVALGNTGTGAELCALIAAMSDRSALVRGHAAWAVGRLAGRDVLRETMREGARAALRERLGEEDDAWVREEVGLALAVLEPSGREV